MSKYPKINTLWKRDMEKGENKGKIIEGEYSCPEFQNIKLWRVSEKIHGTNIRIKYNAGSLSRVSFAGKTDNAMIEPNLLEYLQKTFTVEKMEKALMFKGELPQNAVLYGEGYGPKIQKGGGRYRDDASVILFDIKIDSWWLEREKVEDIAKKLKVDVVPDLGIKTEKEIVHLVKYSGHKLKGFKSQISKDKTLDAEGIVARSYPLLLFRNGDPLMFKLKQVDFKK